MNFLRANTIIILFARLLSIQLEVINMKPLTLRQRSQNLLKVISINLAILFLLLEGISLGFYWRQEQHFFYTRNQTKNLPDEATPEMIDATRIRLDDSLIIRIHPFFGFVTKLFPAAEPKNYEFTSSYQYPLIKSHKDQFIIGVFGGSVAANFGNLQQQSKILANSLKQLPSFANKEIIVLNFAQAGYKQPQQLLVLNYFMALGQEFDMVINIDGFNEVALSNLNNQSGLAVHQPSIQHIMPLVRLANNSLSLEEMEAVVNIRVLRNRVLSARERLDSCSFASCYVFNLFVYKYWRDLDREETLRFETQRQRQLKNDSSSFNAKDSLIYMYPFNAPLGEEKAFAEMAEVWANSSIAIAKIMESQNGWYFHFIQPNQYYPTQRVFTEEEKTLAIVIDHPYAEGVQKGYPELFQQLDTLKQNRVNIFNGVTIFDAERETVYIDDCCHYNQLGREIFAKYVADSIIEVLKEDEAF